MLIKNPAESGKKFLEEIRANFERFSRGIPTYDNPELFEERVYPLFFLDKEGGELKGQKLRSRPRVRRREELYPYTIEIPQEMYPYIRGELELLILRYKPGRKGLKVHTNIEVSEKHRVAYLDSINDPVIIKMEVIH
jgi:hypothetical protein